MLSLPGPTQLSRTLSMPHYLYLNPQSSLLLTRYTTPQRIRNSVIQNPSNCLTRTDNKMSKYDLALSLIDQAHQEDPNKTTTNTNESLPYELHYAQKMTAYLDRINPQAPDLLRLAIRAQHLRRWEIPRAAYPANKLGYHAWRSELQRRQGALAEQICLESGYSSEEAGRVGALVSKAGLRGGDPDTQTLEDVACLVFLDDQFERFERELGDEEKIVGILRKTWAKMSEVGREEALRIELSDRARGLVRRALEG